MQFITLFSTLLALFGTTGWAGYVLQDDYFANNAFFDQFTFWDAEDPTQGFVAYQSYNASVDAKLISSSTGNIYMGVDSASNTPNGRPSVRITSKKTYSQGLVVVDIEHMPGGICGTWPAFWLVGPNWPNGGEIDILEGVNEQTSNDVTLHTGPGCSVSNTGSFSGHMTSTGCASSNNNNTGCQIASGDTASYGAGFNEGKGGVYAMEWTSTGIAVYFFPRSSIPSDVLGDSPNPSGWGTPMAHFTGDCDFTSSFTDQQIVFDTTFCGAWAGNVWSSSSCASKAPTCNSYVENNPSAFADAYWSVNALKVYTNNGEAAESVAPSSAVTATSTSVVYVTQPTSSAAPTTFAVSTTAAAAPTSSDGGYAPVVGGDGSIGENESATSSTAPAAPSGPGWFSNGPGGVVGSWGKRDEGEREVRRERHARHLKSHIKRHSGKRL